MMERAFDLSRDFALRADEHDGLREFTDAYHIPVGPDGEALIYFSGNSLGLQAKGAETLVREVMCAWRERAVNAHSEGDSPWLYYCDSLDENMARIVGAETSEVVLMNALTVNLHVLLASFYKPTSDRYKILIERDAFPSDKYAVASQARWHGYDPKQAVIQLNPIGGEDLLHTSEIIKFIEEHGAAIALVLIGGVNYYTGQFFEMAEIARAAQAAGCVCGFDLAHAAGNVPLQLHDWGVDFAAWCTYKYLNAGPGGPGGLFVHSKHADNPELPALRGWWGQELGIRFQMLDEYEAAQGAAAWQISNPSVLSLAPLRASLDHFSEAGFDRLISKSRRLTSYLEYLITERIGSSVGIITPNDAHRRGAQLSIRIKNEARGVFDMLIAQGVLCDWREPGVIRMSPVPLYNTYMDVFRAVDILEDAMLRP